MKKKLTINALAIGNLKQRKKQYTIMIIGIILAMVFSSSMMFLFSSMFSSINEMQAVNFGRQKYIWLNTDEDTINSCKASKLIGDTGYAHIIGYGFTNEEEDFNGTAIAWLDDKAKELANPVLSEGRYPTAENEIAIESIALIKMNIDANVDDTITLKVRNQNSNETFDVYTEKTYKLVGILKNKRSNLESSDSSNALSLPAAIVADNTQVDLGGKEALTAYFNLYNNTQRKALVIDEYRMDGAAIISLSGNEVLYYGDQNGYAVQETIGFAVIIIIVLMLVCCLGVISSFSSNLKERKKQIGMLRAVGTTKRQIINIFGREAFFISLISMPISIIISYFSVRGIVKLFGDDFIFVPNWWVLIACAIFSVICVMLAAMIPLISASRITPVQAIRNIEIARKMHNKHIKSKKEFNVSSLIAKRSMTFGKGKQIAVSVILVIAIIGSGYAVSWWTYNKNHFYHVKADYELSLSRDGGTSLAINLANNNNGYSESNRQELLSCQYIDKAVGIKNAYINVLTPFSTSDYRKELSDNYLASYHQYVSSQEESIEAERSVNKDNYEEILYSDLGNNGNSYNALQAKFGYDEFISMNMLGISQEGFDELNQYVYDGKIDIDKINSGEEIILVAPKQVGVYFDDGKYGGLFTAVNDDVDQEDCIFTDECDFYAGDKLTLSALNASMLNEDEYGNYIINPDETKRIDKEVTIGAIISETPDSFSLYGARLGIITTIAGLNNFTEGRTYKAINLYLNQECTKEIDDEVQAIINSVTGTVNNSHCISEFGYQQSQKNQTNKIFTAMITVAGLFFAICLSMINNSITASIREGKTKIGTLRAVGASENDLVMAYIKQLMSMLLWGTGIGFSGFFISFLIDWLIHKRSTQALGMICNPTGAIIFCAIVFAVCSLNLWSKIRKEMKNSIVDNIREL